MPASIVPTSLVPAAFRVTFSGGPSTSDVSVAPGVPCLAGSPSEELFSPATPAGIEQGVHLFRSGSWLIGHASEPFIASELTARSESLYRRVLAATRGRPLCRIWNYVPDINAETAGLENYRAFCHGRFMAFEGILGEGFQPQLPAASAVGCRSNQIVVIFAAGETAPTHFENPEQIPAYHYPAEHGPRSPSFARATVVRDGPQTWTFISGTAAIKGHETVAPNALEAQLDCTLDNLRLIAKKSGLGDDLARRRAHRRHFKVYLRHAAALSFTRSFLERSLLAPNDIVTYVQADICRAALHVEIEATIVLAHIK